MKYHDKVALVPEPSAHPNDPLNWPLSKKITIIAIIAFAALASNGSPTSNQLAYNVQAKTYGKSPTELTYGASAAIAGFFAGPFAYPALFLAFGRSAVLFWGLILQLVTQVWAASMTSRGDYIAYIISRLFSGLLGTIPPAVGSAVIVEAFFLHQRGRLFALFELCFLFGVFVIPTIGGFVIENQSLGWPWTFWWTAIMLGVSAILVFAVVEETTFDRDNGDYARGMTVKPGVLQNRLDTFFMPWRRRKAYSATELARTSVAPFAILVSPVVIAAGMFNMICFGFSILTQLFVNVFLQEPISEGGYGFSPQRNAFFSFTSWVSVLAGWTAGYIIGDRLPLAISRRRGGTWHPEYRLWNLILPGIILPIGIGIFGATLEYHKHFMLLALAQFLTQFSAQLGVPICVNYAVESFLNYPIATAIAMNAWRLPLGLVLPFCEMPWVKAVGVGWTFGMAAFFCFGALLMILAVAGGLGRKFRQDKISQYYGTSEDGAKIVGSF